MGDYLPLMVDDFMHIFVHIYLNDVNVQVCFKIALIEDHYFLHLLKHMYRRRKKMLPGKGKWHPRYRKHELLGWVLAVYFLQSLDHAMKLCTSKDSEDITKSISSTFEQYNKRTLPPPTTDIKNLQDSVISSLFGYPSNNPSLYEMNYVSYYTSFKPILQGNILDIIKNSSSSTNNNLLTEMNQQSYLKSNG